MAVHLAESGVHQYALLVGDTATLEAVAVDAAGRPLASGDIRWTSSDPGVATVDAEGRVRAHAAGTTTLRARYARSRAVEAITEVEVLPVATIAFRPGAETAWVGMKRQLLVDAWDARGMPLSMLAFSRSPLLSWHSSDPEVVRVDEDGLATMVGVGTATVTATHQRLPAATLSFTVETPRVAAEPPGAFLLEVRYLHATPQDLHDAVVRAVNRLQGAIVEGLPEYRFVPDPSRREVQPVRVPDTHAPLRTVDDFLLAVAMRGARAGAEGGPLTIREGGLPLTGVIRFETLNFDLERTVLHEIVHALGFVAFYLERLNLLHDRRGPDPVFVGARATQAYLAAAGAARSERPVPIENEPGRGREHHWRSSVFGPELMSYDIGNRLAARRVSAVTLGLLADIGYRVDLSTADPFQLLPAGSLVVAGDLHPAAAAERVLEPVEAVGRDGAIRPLPLRR